MNELIRYDAACRALAEAKAVDEVKDIRDRAVALKAYAKQAKNKDLEEDAAEIRLRAERRVGELMAMQKETIGFNQGGGDHRVSEKPSAKPTLAEVGIDKNLANRARTLASMNENQFSEFIADTRDAVRRGPERQALKAVEIIAAREAYDGRKEDGGKVDDLHKLVESGKRFPVILADPPWLFHAYSGKGKMRSAERHYDTMTLDDIKAMPVGNLAADDCALFLWCVKPELPGALDVVKAWGFEYTTIAFFYVKTNQDGQGLHTGLGYWTRANIEPCILATRGSPMRLGMDVHEIIMTPVGEHSEKPDEVHDRIERLLAGPYLELFARKERPGWTTWGNEVPYNAEDDFSKSIDVAYEVVRERVANGGPTWTPKPAPVDLDIPEFLRRVR